MKKDLSINKKKKAKEDTELVKKFKRAFEDIKHGRISEWKPKFFD